MEPTAAPPSPSPALARTPLIPTPAPRPAPPTPEPDIEAPFVSATPLPFLAALLSLGLGSMALWRIFLLNGPHAAGLAWLAAACSAIAFGVATWTWSRESLGALAKPLAAGLVLLLMTNVLASFAAAGDGRHFTLFMVLCVGAAGWLLEPAWFFAVWVASAGVWLAVAMFYDQPWELQLGRVAGGFGLSTLLLFAKEFIWRKQQDFYAGEAAEAKELEAARAALREAKEERLRLEAELARTHAQHQRLILAASEMLSEHDGEGNFLYASPACKQLLGMTATELQGRGFTEFVHRDDMAAVQAARRGVLEAKEPQTVSHRLRRPDGSYVWVETTFRPVQLSEVRPLLHFTAAVRDITPLRDLEADWLSAEKEQQALETRLAAAEAEQNRLEAEWRAAEAGRQQAQQLRQLAEDERRKEAAARAEAEAARLQLQFELEYARIETTRAKAALTPPPAPAPAVNESEWLAEVDRLTAEQRRLQRELDQAQHARQRAEAHQKAAEEGLRATEAALRKVEAELRTLKTDHQQMEAEWQECDAKRIQAEKDRQKLKAAASGLELELQASREEAERQQQEAERQRKEAGERRKEAEQLRRSLQELQQKKTKLGQEQVMELEQALAMLRELPALLLLWDQDGKLRHVAGGGLELLGWSFDQQLQIKVEAVADSGEPLAEPVRSILADQDYSLELEQNERILSVRCTPWKNELGAVRGLLGLVSDLTAQRRAEARAKRLEAELSAKAKTKKTKEKSEPELKHPSSAEFVGPTMRLLPYEEGAEEAATEGPLPRFAGRALLVDDRREPQRVMTFLLERLGLGVELADFADMAEDQAVVGKHDILFFARSMLRKENKLPQRLRQRGVAAPMLALLEAEASGAQESWCKDAGCDAVLRLPLTAHKLAEALASHLTEAAADPENPEAEAPLLSRHRSDPDFVGLIKIFLEELPGKVAELWSALCVADMANLVKGAHQLKEGASLYGYPELAHQAGRLEQAALEGQAAAALRSCLKDLEKLSRRCERGLAA